MTWDRNCYEAVQANQNLVIIRFYRFSPACITLGRFQKEDPVNQSAISAAGIDVIRRETGGRAVLHDQELTYLVAAGANTPLYSDGLRPSMEKISQALILAFKAIGMTVTFEGRTKPIRSGRGACFDAPSLYELKHDGLKLVGSAQRRSREGFFQHGSIPLCYNALLNRHYLDAPEVEHASIAPLLGNSDCRENFITSFITEISKICPDNPLVLGSMAELLTLIDEVELV
jgi:lipoate-protein ligase A